MGIQTQNSSERLRTIWTPEMDRYFIELMLDQVEKGKRIDDYLFSKRAWKHMTSLFNTKFNFQYEKDVLKNRHKTLRKLYRAAKNLLEQKGFSWDESRQMVTADNSVWDAYTKVHPDARSYRIKTIPYYSDLCLIYRTTSYTTPDGKRKDISDGVDSDINVSEFCDNIAEPLVCSERTMEALHDIMIGEDLCISLTTRGGEDKKDQSSTNMAGSGSSISSHSRTYWQPPMDRYFIDLMLEQVQKGNQVDGVFRKSAWVDMIASFNSKFGLSYDMDILKNRYKTLKRQYNVISNLLEMEGFVWDDTRLMVTADDYVWQDYIKKHSNARQFMTRPVPYYKYLRVICKDPSIDDIDVDFISGQNPDTLVLDGEDQIKEDIDTPSSLTVENSTAGLRTKRRSEHQPISSLSKKMHTEGGSASNDVHEMKSAIPGLSDPKLDDEDSSSFSVENVIDAVQALPEMDVELVLDACDLLEDEKKAKMFLALDVKLRKKWLIRKLRPKPL